MNEVGYQQEKFSLLTPSGAPGRGRPTARPLAQAPTSFSVVALALTLLSPLSLSAQDKTIEELLAPTGQVVPQNLDSNATQAPAPPAKQTPLTQEQATPPLPVETIDPAPHLPGLPSWVFFTAALLFFAFVGGTVLLLRKLIKPAAAAVGTRRNPLPIAEGRLRSLYTLPEDTPLADLATQISLILRHYLADSKADQALYQTQEEFIASENRLRHLPPELSQKTSDFLTELSSLQYAPPRTESQQFRELIDRGLANLHAISSAEIYPPVAQ